MYIRGGTHANQVPPIALCGVLPRPISLNLFVTSKSCYHDNDTEVLLLT